MTLEELKDYIHDQNIPNEIGGRSDDKRYTYHYITPSIHHQAQSSLHHDSNEHQTQVQLHLEKGNAFIKETIIWSSCESVINDGLDTESRRECAILELSSAFKEMYRFIASPTHYHRNGMVNM